MFGDEIAAMRRMGARQVIPLSQSLGSSLLTSIQHLLQILLQILQFASVIATGLMMWKGLGLVANTESPIVVVLRFICFLFAVVAHT